MIIRCPHCEHSRTISESKIPSTAELATCPKCKHRFRFRTLDAPDPADPAPASPDRPPRDADRRTGRAAPSAPIPQGMEVQRPQGAVREVADRHADVWDAVDTLHHRWQAQMDQHVTEVDTPRIQPVADDLTEQQPPEEKSRHETSAALEKASEALRARLESASPAEAKAPATPPAEAKAPATPPAGAKIPAAPATPAASAAPPAMTAPAGQPKAAPSKTPVYLYAEGGPAPEERVERDMRLLRETPESRPTRNLGSLREYPDSADQAPLADSAAHEELSADGIPDGDSDDDRAEGAIPWEHPAVYGWIKGFMSTLHGVMFRSPSFFSCFSPYGSLGPGYLFFLIMGYVTILGSLAWSQALAALLPGAVQGLSSRIALPTMLLLAPIALGLMLLFVTGCIRIILLIFAPEKSSFPLVYRVVSYSMAPFVLSIVPFVGPVIGAGWFIAALIIGCRNALRLSWNLSIFAPLPPAALLLSGLIWYFL